MLEDYLEIYGNALLIEKTTLGKFAAARQPNCLKRESSKASQEVVVRHNRAIEAPTFLHAVDVAEITQASVVLQIGEVTSVTATTMSSKSVPGEKSSSNSRFLNLFNSNNSSLHSPQSQFCPPLP